MNMSRVKNPEKGLPKVFRYNRPVSRIDGYKLALDFFAEYPKATHVIIQGKLYTK